MNLILIVASIFLAIVLVLLGLTQGATWLIERRNPPVGNFAEVGDARLHYVHVPAAAPGLPPLLFLHGASANLKDQMLPLRPLLEGRAEMLFVDRPGHGWSTRASGNDTPTAQAETIARLMERLGMKDAILVGHSFGGAVAAAFALAHPEKVRGILFLSPATHPWPNGETSWYYSVAARPYLGRLFANTITTLAGLSRLADATACVFSPNAVPQGYGDRASIPLVLRPSAFRANAIDVSGLYDFVRHEAQRYPEIRAPSLIVTGDRDTVVYEELHSGGLARDIAGAELVWVRNLGHKPDWVAPGLVAKAIERLAGHDVDLAAEVRSVEARIASDDYATDLCREPQMPELSPQ